MVLELVWFVVASPKPLQADSQLMYQATHSPCTVKSSLEQTFPGNLEAMLLRVTASLAGKRWFRHLSPHQPVSGPKPPGSLSLTDVLSWAQQEGCAVHT